MTDPRAALADDPEPPMTGDYQMDDLIRALSERKIWSRGDLETHERTIRMETLAEAALAVGKAERGVLLVTEGDLMAALHRLHDEQDNWRDCRVSAAAIFAALSGEAGA